MRIFGPVFSRDEHVQVRADGGPRSGQTGVVMEADNNEFLSLVIFDGETEWIPHNRLDKIYALTIL